MAMTMRLTCTPFPRRTWKVFIMVSSAVALAKELVPTSYTEISPAEDEPLSGEAGATNGPLSIRKRTRAPSAVMIISPAGGLDITPQSELEDPRPAKRRGSAEQRPESLMLDLVSTAKSTPLSASNAPDSHPGVSNEPTLGPLDSSSDGDDAGSPAMSLNESIDVENGGDGTHRRRTGEELLRFPRASIVSWIRTGMRTQTPLMVELGRTMRKKSVRLIAFSAELQRRLLGNVNPTIADSEEGSMVRHGLLLDHRTGA
ncbi:hypothetical protein V2W45_517058 [Cenococcum geophilum]